MNRLKDLFGIERWEYLMLPNIKEDAYQISTKGRIRRKAKDGWNYLSGTIDRTRTLVCLGKTTYNVGNLVLYAFGKADAPRGPLAYKNGDCHDNALKNVYLK